MKLAIGNGEGHLRTRIALKRATPKPPSPRPAGVPAWRLVVAVGLLLGLGAAALPVAWGATQAVQEDTLFIVHLKNGKQLRASRYWEVGEDYRFEIFGGVVGLEKRDVARIEAIQRGAMATPSPPRPRAPSPSSPATSRS